MISFPLTFICLFISFLFISKSKLNGIYEVELTSYPTVPILEEL